MEKKETELTPILRQYYDLKKKHPDALLLFRTGDFYESYCDDAEELVKTVGITLTRSSKSKEPDGHAQRMAGFPYHALGSYLPRLIRTGHKVAICDQIEDPRTKKLTKRGITELLKGAGS